MIASLVGLLAFVSATSDLASEPKCGLRHLSACSTTNELIWDRGFDQALRGFGGRARTNILEAGRGPLSDELRAVLGGPSEEPQRLTDGSYFFTACRAHECDNKGAIVLSPQGRIVAAAMITAHYVKRGDSWRLSLDVFVRDRRPEQPGREAIGAWYRNVADHWLEENRRLHFRNGEVSRHAWLITPAGRLQEFPY
jgi:hypothetical protein